MKLLIIFSSQFRHNGIVNSVMNYYKFLDKSDMQMDFVVINEPMHIHKKEIEMNEGIIYVLEMRNKNPLKYIKVLSTIIKKGDYDIVHAHGNSCTLALEMFAAKIGGTKIRIAHSRNTSCIHKLSHIMLRPLFNRTYTHGFACGEAAGRWLFNNKSFLIIKNGSNIDKFRFNKRIRDEYRTKLGLEKKTVIGHVGLFNIQKNHSFLIDIFYELSKLNPDYVLFLIGEGPLREIIEEKVNTLGLVNRVIFYGTTYEVDHILQAMDIMVLPSLYEGLPNVVIEWQIAGLPSVVADTVTRDAKLTNLVTYTALEDGAKAWADVVHGIRYENRSNVVDSIIPKIREAGFDIKDNAIELKSIYKTLLYEQSKIISGG